MTTLTPQQRQAIRQANETPPRMIDPEHNIVYVLVPVEQYETMKRALADDVEEMYPLLADLSPEDWEDAANFRGEAGQ